MSKISYYTQEGLEKLKRDLNKLKTKGRIEIAKQIADARDKGDLTENAEYDAAKDAQGMLELKISKLEEILSQARLVDQSKIDTSRVAILSKVTIKNRQNGAKMTYTIVAEEEADLVQQKISVNSPIAQGIMGKKPGELAKVVAPGGKLEFEIIKIEA